MNLTNLTNADGMYAVASFANQVSGQLLFSGFLIIIFLIILLALKKYGFENGLLVASWTTFILSLMLWSIELVNAFYPVLLLLIAAGTAFYVYKNPS
jgi:hypothetical protein